MKTTNRPDRGGPDPQGFHATADEIAEAHAAGPEDLAKAYSGGRLRKPAKRRQQDRTLEWKLQKGFDMRLKASVRGDYDVVDDLHCDAAGVRGDSLHAMRKIHAAGARRGYALPPESFSPTLEKGLPPAVGLQQDVSLPRQSSNAAWDETRANDGAVRSGDDVVRDRAAQAARPTPAMATSPHSSSIRTASALVTQDDGEPTDPTVRAIKLAHRSPRLLRPGTLADSREKDANRDDAGNVDVDHGSRGQRDDDDAEKIEMTSSDFADVLRKCMQAARR
jgi:hypothetical protein